MTNQELKADLRDIRYYHTHKSMFERAEDTGFKNAVVKKTDRGGADKGGVFPDQIQSIRLKAGILRFAEHLPVRIIVADILQFRRKFLFRHCHALLYRFMSVLYKPNTQVFCDLQNFFKKFLIF